MIKLLCVQPPTDDSYRAELNMVYKSLMPASGLAILASETEKRSKSKVYIKIKMPNSINDDFIEYCELFDVLALSSWFSNYINCLKIAKYVKERKRRIKVIIGGPNTSNLGFRVLFNRSEIDYAVEGEGEDTLWRIIDNHDNATIPNLWYRKRGIPAFTYHKNIDLNAISLWDFRHYDGDEQFLLRHYTENSELLNSPPIGLSITRGCSKSMSAAGRCCYCSIPIKGYRSTNPINVWEQIRYLIRQYNVRTFFETGDDFTNTIYLKKLLKIKPKELDISLRIYANPESLTEQCISMLSDIGVYEIFLGLETADSRISKIAGHKSSIENVGDVIELLQKKKIYVCLPFIFGLPGEAKNTVKKTKESACELVRKYTNIRMVLISLAIPLIGSPWFKKLCSNQSVLKQYNEVTGDDLMKCDIIDYYELLKISLDLYSFVNIDSLVESVYALQEMLSQYVPVGCFGGIQKKSCELVHAE